MATANLAAAGIETGQGLTVQARVGSDGRLVDARVVTSSGSLETDRKATQALRRLRVKAPPTVLVGADVKIAVGPEAVVQAMRFTRDAGTVVVVGQYTDHGATSFNPHLDLNKKHVDVRGCWGSEFSHFYRAAQIVAQRPGAWSEMKLDSYGLNEANEALSDVKEGRVLKALIRP